MHPSCYVIVDRATGKIILDARNGGDIIKTKGTNICKKKKNKNGHHDEEVRRVISENTLSDLYCTEIEQYRKTARDDLETQKCVCNTQKRLSTTLQNEEENSTRQKKWYQRRNKRIKPKKLTQCSETNQNVQAQPCSSNVTEAITVIAPHRESVGTKIRNLCFCTKRKEAPQVFTTFQLPPPLIPPGDGAVMSSARTKTCRATCGTSGLYPISLNSPDPYCFCHPWPSTYNGLHPRLNLCQCLMLPLVMLSAVICWTPVFIISCFCLSLISCCCCPNCC